MAKHPGSDRIAKVPGTHPTTGEAMAVTRRIGKRSETTGTPSTGTPSTVGPPTAALTELAVPASRLGDISHLLVSGADLPEVTILLPSDETPDLALAKPAANRQWAKPEGGMWTSPRTGESSSAWSDWCVTEGFQPRGKRSLALWSVSSVPADAVVIKIESETDAADAYGAFADDPDDGRDRVFSSIDYEALSDAGVDAIWVSDDAAWDANSFRAPAGEALAPFALWDCGSVLWLRPPHGAEFTKLGTVEISDGWDDDL